MRMAIVSGPVRRFNAWLMRACMDAKLAGVFISMIRGGSEVNQAAIRAESCRHWTQIERDPNWRERCKGKLVTAEEAVSHIRSGDKISLTQAHGTPEPLLKALMARTDGLKDITLLSQILYDSGDILREGYSKGIKHYCNFLTANTRGDCAQGTVEYMPAFFFELPRYYDQIRIPDATFLTLSLPDENGMCSFSMNADCAVMSSRRAKTVIAQINRYFPYTHGSLISLDDIDWIVEHHEPIMQRPSVQAGDVERAIAGHIAPLIPDGATLLLGIGGIPDTVLAALHDRKDLGVHSEMFSDGIVDLCKAGAVNGSRKNIDRGKMVANFLVGSQKLFDFVHDNPSVVMMSAEYTNHPTVIARNDNVISINACLQVDLQGQVNADTLHGKPFTGVGGQVDFVRGASMSKGGKSFITLPSTAAKGSVSRIVCRLGEESPVTTTRYDVHYICTEYGAVDLRGKTIPQRARALISIAHPAYREALEFEARKAGLLT